MTIERAESGGRALPEWASQRSDAEARDRLRAVEAELAGTAQSMGPERRGRLEDERIALQRRLGLKPRGAEKRG
jgi:hypothetical protein